MKLYIRSNCDNFKISVNYNRILQSMIYKNLTLDKLRELHDTGYKINGRDFKLFTFSKLKGVSKFNKKDKTLEFTKGLELIVKSFDIEFIQNLSENLILNGMELGDKLLSIDEMLIEDDTVNDNKILVETISPIVAYSTELKEDRKFTRYFKPEEKEFIRIVSENLIKKHNILTKSDKVPDIKIEYVGNSKKTVTKYKGTIIEAYSGQFILEGDSGILNTALSCGLGSKSSQGFGCIELRGVPYDRSDS